MKQRHKRVFWLASLLLVVAAMTAIAALPGTHTTTTFAHDSRHRTPTPTPTTPTPTPTLSPLVIDTTSLPDGNVGNSYDAFVTASGGQGTPKLWSVIAGKLPDGLTMASFYGVQSTIISGTPTKLQTTTFTVQVKDNTGVATQALNITTAPPGDHQSHPAASDRRNFVLHQPLCERWSATLHLVDYGGTTASGPCARQRGEWRDHHQRHSHNERNVHVYRDSDG